MRRWERTLALPVTLVAIALGFLVALQFQTHKNVSAAEQISAERMAHMKTILENSQAQNAQLKENHRLLSEQLEKARQQGGTDPALLAKLVKVQILDGTQAVEGPGIQISIDDRKNDFPLRTVDLARLINTLKFAGAEAISINGQRIVSTTSIVWSGSSIIFVNNKPINRAEGIPYELFAIGDQDALMDYFAGIEVPGLKEEGRTVNVAKKELRIPAYSGSYTFKHAKLLNP